VSAARRIEVRGAVQGIGFRPHVIRLATDLGLDGWVQNVGGDVVIEAAGRPEALTDLARRLATEAPPRAAVGSVLVTELEPGRPTGQPGFTVLASIARDGLREVPPDLSTCAECLAELFDPSDRRYRYPFINCTNCGPRATIIAELPYDRCQTTMAPFPLCADCAAEYADPADRRFHAEPIACPACGPRLAWVSNGSTAWDTAAEHVDDALRRAVDAIASGQIVGVKGIGGFQLVCDATSAQAVQGLRHRKARPAKPLAVMVRDVAAARRLAWISSDEERLLTSVAKPIVLLTERPGSEEVASGIHPDTDQVGLFLPYTPLHHLLLHDLDRPLVVTSGNRSGEPIAIEDTDAFARLGGIADGMLTHDRRIRARYDDSVARVTGGRPALIRRARGYAPESIALPHRSTTSVLAAGAQLKHTFALAQHDRAILSPHIGDLSDHDTFSAFETTLAHLSRLVAISPEAVAHDLHPAYLSTQYATRWPSNRRLPVQHHHAHVASCAAEHGITEPFLGVAYDGLGWGDDGTLWGGELLVATLAGYRRIGRFGTAPMPGGEAAIRRPARMALGYLFGAERLGSPNIDPELIGLFAARFPDREVETVRRMITRGVNSPRASSAGRLFDAVSSILGLRDDVTYEGQAATALETAASGGEPASELPWRLTRAGDIWVYDPTPTIATLLAAVASGEPARQLAAAFHATVVAVTVALCVGARESTGLRTVCLSGGVFQNVLLTAALTNALHGEGFFVYRNERVPTSDGGISYGQAAVAAARVGGG
jgi:hydrogenase maturation protein HypF